MQCNKQETIRLNRLCWFGHVQRMEESRIPKRVYYMNLGTTRLRGRPRNRRQDEVREDGRIAGGEGWQEKLRNREEWKKLLRMARNRCIMHTPMEWMKGFITIFTQSCCWSLFWARWFQSTFSHPISSRSILILLSHISSRAINLLLICTCMEVCFVCVVPNYLNCATFSKDLSPIFLLQFCPALISRNLNI